MILVDTSVWVEHLRKGNATLEGLLHDEQVFCHPFVIGELACGNLKNRADLLALLMALPEARPAEEAEVLHLLESEGLFSRGIGWIDTHLLASALLTGCGLWTLDKKLQRVSTSLGIPRP